jgi:hypothetical protein
LFEGSLYSKHNGRMDRNFHQKCFFESIVGLFEENLEDEWIINTLKWWDK